MRYTIKKSKKKVSVENRSAGYSLDLTVDEDLGDVHFINWENRSSASRM